MQVLNMGSYKKSRESEWPAPPSHTHRLVTICFFFETCCAVFCALLFPYLFTGVKMRSGIL